MTEFLSRFSSEMEGKWGTLREEAGGVSGGKPPPPPLLLNPLTCNDLEVQAYVKQTLALFDVPLSRCHLTLPSDNADSSSEPSAELLDKIGVRFRVAHSSPSSSSSSSNARSDLDAVFRRLLRMLIPFFPDVVKLLSFLLVEVGRVEKLKKKREDAVADGAGEEEEDGEEDDEAGEKIVELTRTAGGSLVHACFHESLDAIDDVSGSSSPRLFHLPAVYSRRHVLLLSAFFLPSLLLSDEELLILKGLQTLETLSRRLEANELDQNALEDLNFRRVLSAVTERVLVKCPSKLIRRRAVEWIKELAPKFDAAGRFFYIRGLYYSSAHAGFRGYLLTYLIKPEMEAALKERETREASTADGGVEHDAHSFIGPNMKSWFGKMFSLPNGAETDLMQQQDTIMAALNLLRYAN